MDECESLQQRPQSYTVYLETSQHPPGNHRPGGRKLVTNWLTSKCRLPRLPIVYISANTQQLFPKHSATRKTQPFPFKVKVLPFEIFWLHNFYFEKTAVVTVNLCKRCRLDWKWPWTKCIFCGLGFSSIKVVMMIKECTCDKTLHGHLVCDFAICHKTIDL